MALLSQKPHNGNFAAFFACIWWWIKYHLAFKTIFHNYKLRAKLYFCKVCFAFCYFMTNGHLWLIVIFSYCSPIAYICAFVNTHITAFCSKNNRHIIHNMSIISVYSPRYNVLFYSLSSSALPSVSVSPSPSRSLPAANISAWPSRCARCLMASRT